MGKILTDLIVCTKCKTRVEYHDGSDGFTSCECWTRGHRDDPSPDFWIEIEDRIINDCAGCGRHVPERTGFRCADCGRPFHQACLDHHYKHGDQKQELRSENLFLKQQVANLEEYMLKGIAFRDELQAQLCRAREAVEKAETGSFRVDAGIECFLQRWDYLTKGKKRHDFLMIDVLEDVVGTLRTQRRNGGGE